MNTEAFTGKAQAYVKARPGYPDEAMEYIYSLAPMGAVFADIGAGTGKFTELLARYGNKIFAVEPNTDMREQLSITLSSFSNVKVVDGTAEATTLSQNSVDVITCAQAIGWFNLDAFRVECNRIGKNGIIVVSTYNDTPGDNFIPSDNRLTSKRATELFFKKPIIKEFPNPILYTREKWIQNKTSVSDSPKSSDIGYNAYVAEMNKIFDRDNKDGILRIDLVTYVYSERIG